MSRVRVYIAGPLTRGDQGANAHRAMEVWDLLWRMGFAPYCPHWSLLQNLLAPRPYAEWMEHCLVWVGHCQALLRLPGESPGADDEVSEAERLNIPVFYELEDLITWRAKTTTSPTG